MTTEQDILLRLQSKDVEENTHFHTAQQDLRNYIISGTFCFLAGVDHPLSKPLEFQLKIDSITWQTSKHDHYQDVYCTLKITEGTARQRRILKDYLQRCCYCGLKECMEDIRSEYSAQCLATDLAA